MTISGGSQSATSGAPTLPFTVAATDTYGNSFVPTPVIWSTGAQTDTGSAAIGSTTGVLTGQNVGTVTVTCTAANGVTQTQQVTVVGLPNGAIITYDITNLKFSI